jgi:hypothetical protein
VVSAEWLVGEVCFIAKQKRRAEETELLAELAGVAERGNGEVQRAEVKPLDLLR